MSRRDRRRLEREARNRRAARTALLDQAAAAQRDAAVLLARAGELLGGRPRAIDRPGPILERMLDAMRGRLVSRLALGGRDRCEHIGVRAPAPAIWYPWHDRLLCLPCAVRAYERIRGTDDDERCDHCRARVRVLYPVILLLPALVADLPGSPLAALPPVLFTAYLCARCRAEDGRYLPGRYPLEAA